MRKYILLILLICFGFGASAQFGIPLRELQEGSQSGEIGITDYDAIYGTYVQRYHLLEDYLIDELGFNPGYWTQDGTLIYYNTGNVGIGTDSPLLDFHVDGAGIFSENLYVGYEPSVPNIYMGSFLNDGHVVEQAGDFYQVGFDVTTREHAASTVDVLYNLHLDSDDYISHSAGTVAPQTNIILGHGLDFGVTGLVVPVVYGINMKLDRDGTGTISNVKSIRIFEQGSSVPITGDYYFLSQETEANNFLNNLRLDNTTTTPAHPSHTLEVKASSDPLLLEGLTLDNSATSILTETSGVVTKTDLSAIQDGTGTDDQQVDNFAIISDVLTFELEDDGQAAHTVDLSPYLDDTVLSQEQVEDYIGGLLVDGTNITLTYNDAANTLTIDAADTDTNLSEEEVQDYAWNVLTGLQDLITVTYDDVNNEIDFEVEQNLSNYTNDVGFLIAETQNIEEVLTEGDDANGLNIENIGQLSIGGVPLSGVPFTLKGSQMRMQNGSADVSFNFGTVGELTYRANRTNLSPTFTHLWMNYLTNQMALYPNNQLRLNGYTTSGLFSTVGEGVLIHDTNGYVGSHDFDDFVFESELAAFTGDNLGSSALTNTQGVDASFDLNGYNLNFTGSLGSTQIDDNGRRVILNNTSGAATTVELEVQATLGNVGTVTAHDFWINTNGSPHVYLDHADQRVGIYNSTPATELDITGTLTTDDLVITDGNESTGRVWTATDASGNGSWQDIPAGHDAVTLAGTPDYLTLADQEITLNKIDLTTDVTGVLGHSNVKNFYTADGNMNGSSGDRHIYDAGNIFYHGDPFMLLYGQTPGMTLLDTTGTGSTGVNFLRFGHSGASLERINNDLVFNNQASGGTYKFTMNIVEPLTISSSIVDVGADLQVDYNSNFDGTITATSVVNDNTATKVMGLDGSDEVIYIDKSSIGGQWDRDSGNGYIYPSTLTDLVGINTNTPEHELEVNGDVWVSDNIRLGGSSYLSNDLIISSGVSSLSIAGGTGMTSMHFDLADASGEYIFENQGVSGIESFKINSDGDTETYGGSLIGSFQGTAAAGAIQWNGSNFQGYDGATWNNLDESGGSSVWVDNGDYITANDGEDLALGGDFDPDYHVHIIDESLPAFLIQRGATMNNFLKGMAGTNAAGFFWDEDKSFFFSPNASTTNNLVDYSNAFVIRGAAQSNGGYMGIGEQNPAEKLDVDGAIKVGTTSGTNAGTIRWDGTNFQGYDGSSWVNLDESGGGSDGNGIYDGSGSLSADVTVNQGANKITFSNTAGDYTEIEGSTMRLSDVGGNELRLNSAGTYVAIINEDGGELRFGQGGNVRMKINSDGDVYAGQDILMEYYGEAKMIQEADQTSTSATYALLPFEVNHRDNGLLTADQANDRITVETNGAGTYDVTLTCRLNGNTNGTEADVALYINGSIANSRDFMPLVNQGSRPSTHSHTAQLDLADGDYLQAYYRNATASGTATVVECHLQAKKIITN